MMLPIQSPPVLRNANEIRSARGRRLTGQDDPHCVGLGSLAQVCWYWDDSRKAVCFYMEIAGIRSGLNCVGQTSCTSQGFDVGFIKALASECVNFQQRTITISGEACAFGQCADGSQSWNF